MSYDIYIGNAVLESEWSVEDGPFAEWVVACMSHPEAPAFPFDEMTGNGNGRHPSYSGWSDFCEATGLYAMFYGVPIPDRQRHEGGILSRHPGIVPLTPLMLSSVTDARERRRARCERDGAVPGFDFTPAWNAPDKDDGVRGRDSNLARLIWLEWWMTYALAHCERPAISNR